MYLDYDLSFDWDIVRQAVEDGTLDMQSAEALAIVPKYGVMRELVDNLVPTMIWMHVMLALTTLCSFRTPVNILYAFLTGRPYKRNEMTYLDSLIILYFCFFMGVYGYWSQEVRLERYLIDIGMVDTESPMHIFAANMMWHAMMKSFRYDILMGIFCLLILGKQIQILSFTI